MKIGWSSIKTGHTIQFFHSILSKTITGEVTKAVRQNGLLSHIVIDNSLFITRAIGSGWTYEILDDIC